jgi:hypothetical protein
LENKRSSWQLCRAITQLTEEFELKHLKKGENDSKNWSKYNWCTFNQLKVDQENGSIL